MSHINDTPAEGKTFDQLFLFDPNKLSVKYLPHFSILVADSQRRRFFFLSAQQCFFGLHAIAVFGQKHIGLFCGYVGLFLYQQTCASQSVLPRHLPQFRIHVGIGT